MSISITHSYPKYDIAGYIAVVEVPTHIVVCCDSTSMWIQVMQKNSACYMTEDNSKFTFLPVVSLILKLSPCVNLPFYAW